jgi:hypothetical protein
MGETTVPRESEDYKNTKEKLEKLLQNISGDTPRYEYHSTRPDLFWRNHEIEDRWDEAERISNILRRMKGEVAYPDNKVKSMSKMLAYLGLVESLGSTLMDIALLLLIANGLDVHARRGTLRHVTKLDELKNVETGDKLQILKTEGLEIFRKIFNAELRNIVAHLKFTIGENGEIVNKRNNQPVNIDGAISDFWFAVDVFSTALTDAGFLRFSALKRNNQ